MIPAYKFLTFTKSYPLLFFRRFKSHSTIFALSSGIGKCGVSVVRVSGPGVKNALFEVGGFKKLPDPRKAELRKIRDPITKEVIDHGLVFWFPNPHSFTGEDCCEFQVHGSTAVVSALLGSLGKLSNFRPAEPGEFTKRAFYSGKMDLTAVEGLSALIDSETEVQRKHALYQMGGALFSLYNDWSESLLKCLAYIEAFIDFDEDQDIDRDVLETVSQKIDSLIVSVKSHIEDGRKGERVREGVQMTILGAPNAGKSSLLNLLSKRRAAIVSSMPGTTRDIVETHLDLNGFPVNVADTAGLRSNPGDLVEIEGISRALEYAKASDLMLLVIDYSVLVEWANEMKINTIDREEFKTYFEEFVQNLGIKDQVLQNDNLKHFLKSESRQGNEISKGLIILNKADLVSPDAVVSSLMDSDFICGISCKTEFGINVLLNKITKQLTHLCGDPKRALPGFSRPYQRHCLEECLSCLVRYRELASKQCQIDLSAEELRRALNCLGRLTGQVSAEQLLDVIFRDFCIGK